MDSSGLGALVSNFKITQDKGISFSLNNVNSKVMAVLNLTELDRVFEIETVSNIRTTSSRHLEEQLPTTHPSIRSWMKRFIDIVGSMVGLVITSILFIPITIAITIDNPGPIFFQQTRCGWMGKRFKIWKFRSMCVDAEAKKSEVENQAQGAFFKNDNDPRITKIGNFLRKTRIDEIPQLISVLKGEMCLIGPRPERPEIDNDLKKNIPCYENRYNIKPGISGWAQVNYPYGASIEDARLKLSYDLYYIKNFSILL